MAATTPAPTAPRRSQARERLLEVASDLFYREGINGVGVDRVLETAGVTRTTLYHHFSGKEALVAAYLGREDETIRGYFAAAAGQTSDPDRMLELIVQGIADDIARYHTRGCPFINAAAEFPDSSSEVRTIVSQHRAWFRQTLRDALAAAGLAGRPRLTLEPDRYRGALEIHIEQGTQLERRDLRIGVVTGIVAIRQFRIVIEGQQDHTGGTTMAERRDAALSAVRLLAAIDTEFPKVCGDHSVWTAGRIVVEPNQPMIIPGRCEIAFSFRDLSEAVMDRMEACLRALVRESDRRERCPATIEEVSRLKPELCDPAIVAAFAAAADELCPGAWRRMQSGALHDSQVLARKLPVGMLFVPSIGGISHHWTEDTAREDLELGCRVMAAAAERLLG